MSIRRTLTTATPIALVSLLCILPISAHAGTSDNQVTQGNPTQVSPTDSVSQDVSQDGVSNATGGGTSDAASDTAANSIYDVAPPEKKPIVSGGGAAPEPSYKPKAQGGGAELPYTGLSIFTVALGGAIMAMFGAGLWLVGARRRA